MSKMTVRRLKGGGMSVTTRVKDGATRITRTTSKRGTRTTVSTRVGSTTYIR